MFSLKQTIDPSVTADEEDVFNTKTALARLGYFKGPIDTIATHGMIDGVRAFQANNGLTQDGVMKPDGPTIKKMNAVLANSDQPNSQHENRTDQECAAIESQISNNTRSLEETDKLLSQKENELVAAKDELQAAERTFAETSASTPASIASDIVSAALGGPTGAAVAGANSGVTAFGYTSNLTRLNNAKNKVAGLENVVSAIKGDKTRIEAILQQLERELSQCQKK